MVGHIMSGTRENILTAELTVPNGEIGWDHTPPSQWPKTLNLKGKFLGLQNFKVHQVYGIYIF